MPAYSLAIFDFDGTLADSFPWFCSILNQTAEHFDLRPVAPDEIEGLRELGSREVIAHLGVPLWKMPMIATYMRRLATEAATDIKLYPGVAEALKALADAGVRLVIVSSNAEAPIRQVLGPAADLIDHYVCGASLWGKAAKFRKVLTQLGIAPTATIAIGDELRDIDAARDEGITAGAVTFGFNSAAALRRHNPDFMFDSFDELRETLLR